MSFSFWDLSDMKDTLLLSYTSQDYFLIIYSLFFRLDNFFHCSIITFTDLSSFISILLLSLSSDFFFFYIFVTVILVLKFPFDSFLYLLFADESLLRLSIFPLFSGVFTLTSWNTFTVAGLQSLSYNFNICVISVLPFLITFSHRHCDFPGSLYAR